MPNSSKENRVCVISLGCTKNLVDTEHLLGLLKSKGFELTSRTADAHTAVINTCGFLQEAAEESIQTILQVAELKKRGTLKKLIVVGCFPQRYGYKLRKEMPEVDGWLGTGEIYRIGELMDMEAGAMPAPFFLSRPTFLADHGMPRIQTTPPHTAYLKIAEGCFHHCSYCMIPVLRGPYRSRGIESLVREAEEMVGRGVKEINLIAQDVSAYGRDMDQGGGIEDLLVRLAAINGMVWLRLMYCHPNGISNRLLELMEDLEVICPYLDLPFQHTNERLLEAMGRPVGTETPLELIQRIRSGKRRISLRSTLMVGFPGETESMFNELRDFVSKARLDHLGVFVFSPERGTRAGRMDGRVDPGVAQERRERVMALQMDLSRELNQKAVGRTLPVLIEGFSPETELLLTGRTATMAPDVDGRVLVNKGKGRAGEIMPVRIGEAHAYDLVGEIVG